MTQFHDNTGSGSDDTHDTCVFGIMPSTSAVDKLLDQICLSEGISKAGLPFYKAFLYTSSRWRQPC